MKKLSYIILITLFSANAKGQASMGINYGLLKQIAENESVRGISENLIQKEYQGQIDLYEEVNKKLGKVLVIHNTLYGYLKNIDDAIMHGKRFNYFLMKVSRIRKNAGEMIAESKKSAKYAPLFYELYSNIIKESTDLAVEVSSFVMKENKNILMDSYDREIILEKMMKKATRINGDILLITLRLKQANRIGFLRSVPKLSKWIWVDEIIINDIMKNAKYIKR